MANRKEPNDCIKRLLRTPDPWLPGILVVGLLARILLPWLWPDIPCSFDECTYLQLAERIRAGEGMTPSQEWLWAPGYPYLIAIVHGLSAGHASIHQLQIVLALVCIVLVHHLAGRFAGMRAARVASLIFALHPTFVFYSGRTWSEVVYSTALLGLVFAVRWSRRGEWPRALLPGVVMGLGILLRGLAIYVLPLLALVLIWPDQRSLGRMRWKHVLVMGVVTTCLVVPYSISATRRHGGFVISDATLGRMMWLGNNSYPPITYDFGNGVPMAPRYQFPKRPYRPACDRSLSPVALNDCEIENGLAWIRSHPGEFVTRIPYRAAQLFNPNSFLTRHMRASKYPGMPEFVVEVVSILIVLTSFAVFIGGAIGLFARARDSIEAFPISIILMHIGAICLLAGLTRYRVAWEPFVVVYAAAFFAHPRECWRLLKKSRLRAAGLGFSLAVLVPLMLWFLPAGFPSVW